MLCIPEHIVVQLDLQTESLREVTVADGRAMKFPYAGPVQVNFEDRLCFVGALVMGDEVLLGAVPSRVGWVLVQSHSVHIILNINILINKPARFFCHN